MTFAVDTEFCCLALRGPRLAVTGEHMLFPHLVVSSIAPFKLEPHWVTWLGTIQAETFESSTLYITAVHERSQPAPAEPSYEFLGKRVRILHHVLVLLGCGYNETALMVGGNTNGGSRHSGPIRFGLTPCFRPYYRKHRNIELSDLRQAATLSNSLEHIFQQAPNSPFKRLRKGFKVWIRGAEEREEYGEKLHSFVRAAEALLKPTLVRERSAAELKKRSRKDRSKHRKITEYFVSRGQTFIGQSKENGDLLRQFYDIRSSVEHTKDILPKIRKPKGIDKKEGFEFRALQCEIFASAAYIRILTTPHLLQAFSSERKIEAFWSRNSTGRMKLWGELIEIDIVARQEFRTRIPHIDW